uniref:Putative ovule protein n=1 Tax=Solanum chacoense TaxID=4108 RepID=A0A0V0GVH2_SOLCH
MLEVSSSKARGLPFGSSSSHRACLVRVTSPMWFASYCIGAGVLPCGHPKGSGCRFPLSSKKKKF